MARLVIIGITQQSLRLAIQLSEAGYWVTVLEQQEDDLIQRLNLQELYQQAKQKWVGVVFSTPVVQCQSLGENKELLVTSCSVKMSVPFVICAFSENSQHAKQLHCPQKNVYFIQPNQTFNFKVLNASI